MRKLFLTVGLLLLLCGAAKAATFPLEIIQPRAGLTPGSVATNRFYKAYPGIEYNVKVSVLGGEWPYAYSLDADAPAGMVIDHNTGVISWPSPATTTVGVDSNGAPRPCGTSTGCFVTVRVLDAVNTATSVKWPVWVGTTGFLFVNPVSGTHKACGTANYGTIGDPMKTINDWYCTSKADQHYPNTFVYYYGGAEVQNDTPAVAGITGPDTRTLQWNTGTKPMVHMAYPGQSVTIDMNGKRWHHDVSSQNFYVDNISFHNGTGGSYGNYFVLGGNGGAADHVTVRRSSIDGVNDVSKFCPNPSLNQSLMSGIQFETTNNQNYNSHYYSLTENSFSNVYNGYAVVFYQYDHVVVESNVFNPAFDLCGGGATHILGLKGEPTTVSIVNNVWNGAVGQALEVLNVQVAKPRAAKFEARFNLIKNASGRAINVNGDSPCDPGNGIAVIYRNTIIGGDVAFPCSTTNQTNKFYDNVVQSPTFTVQCGVCPNPIDTHNGHNLGATTGLVDPVSGVLTTSSSCNPVTNCIGAYGYQLSGSTPAPQKPGPDTNLILIP